MDYYSLLENERKAFSEKQALFTKEDLKYISGKDSFKGKLTGFLTKNYYQREKLIQNGELFYGYVFSFWGQSINGDSPTIFYILFSPERKIMENPSIFKEIHGKLRLFLDNKPQNKKEKTLWNLLKNPVAEAPFEEIPFSLTDNHVIYFCKLMKKQNFAISFHLGLNLFIANPTISKQILFLPEKYTTENFRKLYEERKLML